ncbi:MAG: hypothetical protein HUU21_11320 [Polyangiaceae bacterium]|nr:hypothetical protein [Polyangiaceae bacterium]
MDNSKSAAVQFSAKRGNGVCAIKWEKLDQIGTSFQIAEPPEVTVLRTWKLPPESVAELQHALAPLRHDSAGQGDVYHLILNPNGTKTFDLRWNPDTETADVAKFREVLERIGHAAFVESSARHERGVKFINNAEHARAVDELRNGLRALGNLYHDPKTIDDSGMKLILAEQNAKQGKNDAAAIMMSRMLESRLQQYGHKFSITSTQ